MPSSSPLRFLQPIIPPTPSTHHIHPLNAPLNQPHQPSLYHLLIPPLYPLLTLLSHTTSCTFQSVVASRVAARQSQPRPDTASGQSLQALLTLPPSDPSLPSQTQDEHHADTIATQRQLQAQAAESSYGSTGPRSHQHSYGFTKSRFPLRFSPSTKVPFTHPLDLPLTHTLDLRSTHTLDRPLITHLLASLSILTCLLQSLYVCAVRASS